LLPQYKKGGGDFVLFESASGYALLEVVEFEEIGSSTEQMQQTVADLQRFSRLVKLKVRYAWPCVSSRAVLEAACTFAIVNTFFEATSSASLVYKTAHSMSVAERDIAGRRLQR
jgi:hypothetical protein